MTVPLRSDQSATKRATAIAPTLDKSRAPLGASRVPVGPSAVSGVGGEGDGDTTGSGKLPATCKADELVNLKLQLI